MARPRKILGCMVIVLVVGVLAARMALPFMIRDKVNQELADLPEYTGHVDRVHLALWRGAIVVRDLTIKHKDQDFALTIKEASILVKWLPLLRKMLVADLKIESPRIRMLVEKPAQAVKQTAEKGKAVDVAVKQKTGKSLPELLSSLIPFRIDKFILSDGSIRIRDKAYNIDDEVALDKAKKKDSGEGQAEEPGLEARINDITITINNLTNSRQDSPTLQATGVATARLMNEGYLHLDLRITPTAEAPQFYSGIEIKKLELTAFDPILRWQWGIDAKRGTFELYSEAAAANGGFKGYVKPLIYDLKMVDLKKEHNPVKIVKEAVVGAVASVLTNPKKKDVGTRLPFEGKFENPHPGIWVAVIEVLRNAFIQALKPSLDKSIKIV